MPKDLDQISKQIDKNAKDMSDDNKSISKSIDDLNKNDAKILKDISDIKKQIKDIGFKVDLMLEILNNFTIMLAEDDEDLEENYDIDDPNESWVPKEEEFWEDDEDDENI